MSHTRQSYQSIGHGENNDRQTIRRDNKKAQIQTDLSLLFKSFSSAIHGYNAYLPRSLLMPAPITGQKSRRKANSMMQATSVEFVQKILKEPFDMIIDCLKASSALSPSTMANTMGAIG